MPSKKIGLQGTEAQAKTRTLLALWNLGGTKTEVKKSELTKRVQRSHEKAGDYQGIFEELEKEGAISIATKSRSLKVSLTDKGVEILNAGLKSPDFQFGGRQVRAKDVDSLLKWIRNLDSSEDVPVSQNKPVAAAIKSYEEFEQIVLEVYDHLNWDHDFDNLVPIYRIRRQIGDRVSHAQFNEWMLEMQANKVLQLYDGSIEDNAPDKIGDSINTEQSGFRCYAKRLTP
jgi:predicted transcriptional regulator